MASDGIHINALTFDDGTRELYQYVLDMQCVHVDLSSVWYLMTCQF